LQTRFPLTLAKAALATLAVAPLALPVMAAERVILANGFDMRCDHHAQVGTQVRLFMNADESSYIDLRLDEITSVEQVPEAPPQSAPTVSTDRRQDTRLSPADLHEMLADAGQQHNLDIDLLASVVRAESAANPRAVSRAGAQGLMQLMPSTAADLGVNDSFAPGQNIRGGSAYLDGLLSRYHDNLALALAAYNAGPAAVDKYHGIPPYHETRAYVARVIHEFNRRVLAREAKARQAINSPQTAQASASR